MRADAGGFPRPESVPADNPAGQGCQNEAQKNDQIPFAENEIKLRSHDHSPIQIEQGHHPVDCSEALGNFVTDPWPGKTKYLS